MRSLKYLTLALALTAFVSGPVLAQDMMEPATDNMTTEAPLAPATDAKAPAKAHAKTHAKHAKAKHAKKHKAAKAKKHAKKAHSKGITVGQ